MNQMQTSPRNHQPIIDRTQKILALQQQLINVRKQMSKKQSQWQKEKSNLLSKLQVHNIENMELKQRNANLIKINQTLSNAMSAAEITHHNTDREQGKTKRYKQFGMGEDVSNFSCEDGESMRKIEKYQEEIKRLNRTIGEKDFQLNNLSKMMTDFKNKLQEREDTVNSLEECCYNLKRKVQKKQEQILKLHKQIQEVQQKLEQNNQYIDQTRRKSTQPQKKVLPPQQLDQSADYVKKYTKNSSYLMMKPTPDHSAYDGDNSSNWNQINLSQVGYDDQQGQQQQKLLCEVCNRVYSFVNFEAHVKVCGYKANNNVNVNTKNLFQKKKQIQIKLERIRKQEQKQNMMNRYYKNQPSRFQFEDNMDNRDKIIQIRQIAKDLTSNKRQTKKNHYNDFSIKSNYYY